MSTIAVNAITDASGGNTASINGATPTNDNLMGRNRIINGDMRISQRGTSFTGVSLFQYTLDRHKTIISYTGGTTNITQENDGPTSGDNSIRYTHATANTSSISSYVNRQSIETANVTDFTGKNVTASFWYKSSKTGNHVVGISPTNTTGGSAVFGAFTVNSANTWEYKTVTVNAFVGVTAWSANNSEGAYIDIGFTASGLGQTSISTGDYFAITGVQLEAGSVATSFERRSYGQELALCQRYFWKSNPDNISNGNSASGSMYSSTFAALWATYPVPMRGTPTASFSSNSYYIPGVNANATGSAQSTVALTNQAMSFEAGTSATAGLPIRFNGQISVSAEL